MPNEARFFILTVSFCLLFSAPVSALSFQPHVGYLGGDTIDQQISSQRQQITPSGIVDIPPSALEPNKKERYLIFGTKDSIDTVSQHSKYQISTKNGFFAIALLSSDTARHLSQDSNITILKDFELEPHQSKETPEVSRIQEISNAKDIEFTGKGVNVAIVDTGVDFSNPDMKGTVARDHKNHPVMLDADGQGIVITRAKFFAYVDDDGVLRNYTKKLPPEFTSTVYWTKKGVFLDLKQGGKGSEIPIYNSFYPQAGDNPVFNGTIDKDMKIGNNKQDFIKSKSGIYRLGVMYQGALSGPLTRIQVVPVLVVDSQKAGVYDTIIPDMSTSWEDYTRFDLRGGEQPKYDFDFTDEKPIIIGSGKEVLLYDSDKDGKPDYTAGMVGARVVDLHGAIQNKTALIKDNIRAVNGTLLEPIDKDGEYFGVMTDFFGHGTSSAASIVSQGTQKHDIYNDTKKYTIKGVAPDAKIIPVKALWFGDAVYGWLWSAGFDNVQNKWQYNADKNRVKADIISNSWGISNFPNSKQAPATDMLSLIQTMLIMPRSLDPIYPGVIMVNSAGNSGHGYGTMGMPSASPFAISVGATTNNVFVGYGPFKGEPRFGNTTQHKNEIVDFSSRGPGIIGDPKPDLVNIGAHSFTPTFITSLKKEPKKELFTMFGGTSMAAPIVSGTAAILVEALKEKKTEYDPFKIKNILMSTATDLQNDPLTQGAGLVNAKKALEYVNKKEGTFLIHNTDTYKNIKEILEPPLAKLNVTSFGMPEFQFPEDFRDITQTSWFGGRLQHGNTATATFTIENPSDKPLHIDISSEKMQLIKHTKYQDTTKPRQQDLIQNKSGKYAPNYVRLADIKQFEDIREFYDTKKPIPEDSALMILNLNFPFDQFMNKSSDRYASDMKISSLYVYDWNDKNNDTKVTSNELSMVSRGGSWGTVQEVRVSDPEDKFKDTPLVGVYPVPTRYSYWAGDTKKNSTAIDYTLSATYYKKAKWDEVWLSTNSITIPPNSASKVTATIAVPHTATSGVYQGFLKFESSTHQSNVPVTFVVTKKVDQKDSIVLVQSSQDNNNPLYGAGYVKGAFDMTNRYMAGDWRQFYFDIEDPTINTASLDMSWNDKDTNLSVFVVAPDGHITGTNVPSGVFGEFMSWPSLDWLGTSVFSQGGGFYPVKNKNETSTGILFPINQTGTYSLLVHNTLFGANKNSTTENITITAKFATFFPDDAAPKIILDIPQVIGRDHTAYPEIRDQNLAKARFYLNENLLDYDFANPLNLDSLHDGKHTLLVSAVDTVGNNSTKIVSFEKDTKPPDIRIISPQNLTAVSDKLDIELDIDDQNPAVTDFVKVTLPALNQTISDNTTVSFDVSSLEEGEYAAEISATDSLGNRNEATLQFAIDHTQQQTLLPEKKSLKEQQNFATNVSLGIVIGVAIGVAIMFVMMRRFKNK